MAGQQRDVTVCAPIPLEVYELKALPRLRRQLLAQLQAGPLDEDPFDPIDAYITLLAERPDPYIVNSIDRLYTSSRLVTRQFGYIYMLRDIQDEPFVVKIGYTRRNPFRRQAEWRNTLQSEHVVLLCAYRTRAPQLAEAIAHQLLRCQRIENRVNRVSGRLLTEFFRVPQFRPVQYLLHAIADYVTYYTAESADTQRPCRFPRP